MDPLFWKALLLGIVEGLTEFLPVSSTGHLIVVGDLLHFNDDKGKVFEVVIQLGAILAVCWHYRRRLIDVAGNLRTSPQAQRFALNLGIAFLPAAVLGLLLHHVIKTYLFSPLTVAGALVVGGVAIIAIERYPHRTTVTEVDAITPVLALKLGFAQTLAMFPGVSRSGATIMGGLLLGLSRTAATEFSFFLAIPTMFAASGYDLLKSWSLFHWADLPWFAAGFVMAFFSALLAVRGLLAFVAHHSFVPFAWYRIVFGGALLAWLLV